MATNKEARRGSVSVQEDGEGARAAPDIDTACLPRVDFSTLASVARCHTQAMMRYGLGYTIPDEAAALRAGTAAHIFLANWFAGKGVRECLDYFEGSYRAFAEATVPATDRLAFHNLVAILKEYAAQYPKGAWPFEVIALEVEFEIPVIAGGTPYLFCGRIDGIVQGKETGALAVLEHKTTRTITTWWASQWKTHAQVTGYIWAAQQVYDERVSGAYLNAIEFKSLPSSTRKCRDHGVPYEQCAVMHARSEIHFVSRTKEETTAYLRTQGTLARTFLDLREGFAPRDITGTQQQGRWNGSCTFCEFADFCLSGRDQKLIPSLFRYEPWEVIHRPQTEKPAR